MRVGSKGRYRERKREMGVIERGILVDGKI